VSIFHRPARLLTRPSRVRRDKFTGYMRRAARLLSETFSGDTESKGATLSIDLRQTDQEKGQPYDTAQSARVIGTDCASPERTRHNTYRLLADQASNPKHGQPIAPMADVQ
jgi:hypothetical protein